jgi:hypothetical protein
VKCPHCGNYFRVDSTEAAPEKLTAITSTSAKSTRFAGAMLLFVGLIGFFCDAGVVVLSVTHREALIDEVIRQAKNPDAVLKRWLNLPEEFNPEEFREQIGDRLEIARKIHFAFAAVSLVITLGGVGLLLRKWHRLAVLSCFLSMLNLGFFCCLMGLPIGIFALVKLLDPEVKSEFR